jgi:4a-hydroxytetrahydrobiopterin dehydratase
MTDDATKLTGRQITDAGLDGWAYVLNGLQTRIRTGDYATGLELVAAIGAVAAEAALEPDLDLRPDHVDVRLFNRTVYGVTARHLRLARAISTVAAERGAALESASASGIELALDTPDMSAVLPFWQSVLGLPRAPDDDDILDPDGALPAVWFQPSGREEPRQRWHPDVWIEPAQVRPRIEAALAAGGTLVSDEHAPSYWVLADPDGNRVCLCTWQERD